jgi:hypothetical protein
MPGRSQPAARAAAADVPSVVSLLNPSMTVLATSCDTACSQAGVRSATACPFRSVTDSTGDGGHHVPPLISVADTFANSSGLTGLLPRVNDGLSRKYFDWGSLRCGSSADASGAPPASFDARVDRSPNRCAMSSTAGMPTFVSRPTNAVFGDVANPSDKVIGSG